VLGWWNCGFVARSPGKIMKLTNSRYSANCPGGQIAQCGSEKHEFGVPQINSLHSRVLAFLQYFLT